LNAPAMMRMGCSFGTASYQLSAVSYQLKENHEPSSTHLFS
jgi:hypothetical protein